MSSNAFARSRPRVRHQRVPKTPSYAHPRFLKLVKELVRIDEANKKLVEPTSSNSDDNVGRDNLKLASSEESSATTSGDDDCSSTIQANTEQQIIVQLNQSRHSHHNHHQHQHHHNQHNHSSRYPPPPQQPQLQHMQQQQPDVVCCPGLSRLNYPSCINEANTSNGYRSLGFNQSTSALHDNYYRQNNNTDNQQQITAQMHHSSYPNNHQRQYSYPSNQQESLAQTNNVMHQSHHIDYRGLNKCPSSSSSANALLGYSKASTTQLSVAQVPSSSDSDPRQDENRSKRKRSGNEVPNSARKCLPTSSSPPICSKKRKSSPEPPRPLSPSFTKCPICLLDCMNRDPSFTNTCFHLFCFVCIENWSKSKATCPLCRTKFSKIIYNIRSESCFEEKIASPLRRDDDDDRFTYEQLSHSMIHSRTSHAEEARLLFDNLRNNDVLMPHLVFTNQIDPRQVDLHSFNSIASNTNFNSTVPHAPFSATNYNPVGSNYIALIPSNNRLPTNSTSSAITSAYPANTSLTTSSSSDTSNRAPRVSRSGRYIYSRNYDLANIDSSIRGPRSTSSNLNHPVITLDSRQHHHPILNPGQHHHHHTHHSSQQQQHRSTVATIELGPARQSHHQNIPLPYPIPTPRHYTNPNVYTRRPYTNPPIDQHILDEMYTQIPDI